ncbi:cyclin-C1-1 isoform X1 [Sorghum bicolor]|uniref:cyclin-C1-1 isoform X1 n=1 Tax=Sorghum bicolor TaxID=4558 RepID=UPI000B423DA5|nr:cyclin-C1-1 isoform X1 [Sorghum bicolor]|eukprot:XP_021309787.1 cyclin-C1-1 isoform X1 [Sorghum bicolor]
MAANFWTSSHCKQLLDPDDVDLVPAADRERGITPEEFRLIKIHMSFRQLVSSWMPYQYKHLMISDIWRLAQQVKVRQRVIATAVTYFRRVYTRKSMSDYDPRLVAPTCLYLASKVEESTVQARLLVFYIKKMCGSDDKYRFEIKDILEMEMKLLEALDYYLVVFHPYRPLLQLLQDAGITDLTQFAWGLVNDTYKMDLILIYPPYMIALACIYIASVLKDKDTTAWFEELRVDMNIVKNISMEILDFYDTYKIDPQRGIPEDKISSVMNKLPAKA